MAIGAHGADLAIARDSELACRQESFLDFTLGAIEQRLHLVGIESNFVQAFGEKMGCGHGDSSDGVSISRQHSRFRLKKSKWRRFTQTAINSCAAIFACPCSSPASRSLEGS